VVCGSGGVEQCLISGTHPYIVFSCCPLTWEQEEKQRAEVQKIHWHDNIEDLVVRYRPKGS